MKAYEPPIWMPRADPHVAPTGAAGMLTGLVGTTIHLLFAICISAIMATWWVLCGVSEYVFTSPSHARAWAGYLWQHRREPAPGAGGWLSWWWSNRRTRPPGCESEGART